jgi:hypothetical protein
MPRFNAGIFFALLLAITAHAQPGPPPPPAGRILLYSEPDYRGEILVVEAGTSLDNLESVSDSRGRRWNNRVMSVRLEGPVVLTASESPRFGGAQIQVSRDLPDLSAVPFEGNPGATWARTIASLRATPLDPGVRTVVQWNRHEADEVIRVAFRDLFGREADEIGLRTYRSRLVESGWTEIQLREEICRSPEYRNRDLNAIARRAYREVLGRDVDPSGLAAYTRALSRGKGDIELRLELRRSREGTEHAAKEIVIHVYREMFKHDPDAAALANYTKAIVDRGWDENRLREELKHSPEFHRPR